MICIGISYKTANVRMRECYSFSLNESEMLGRHWIDQGWVQGILLVSTCNRTEFYLSGVTVEVAQLLREINRWKVEEMKGRIDGGSQWYLYQDREAIRHLIEVAAGMDSMVLGEDDILHQIKQAYEMTLYWGQSCYELNRIVQSAFRWVKKIKSETNLSKTPVSVATLVTKLLNGQRNQDRITSILMIGATGKIGGLVRKNLSNNDKYRLVLTRRDKSDDNRAQEETADFMNSDTRWVEYEQRYQYLAEVDVVICATMSPTHIFLKKYIEDITKPMIWIDLSVPADIDPEIGVLPRMKRYDIDRFAYIARENNQKKASALIQGKIISLQGAKQILDSLMIPR